MKVCALSFCVLSAMAAHSYAEGSSQDQLNALQAQISSLQTQINHLNTKTVPSNLIMLDTANPFGLMPSPTFALALMQSKSAFNTPLVLGGYLEADVQDWGGSFTNTNNAGGLTYNNGTDVAISSANLYTMANMGQWVTGYLSLQGNVGGNSNQSPLFDKAFITVGNLQNNPLFFMAGKSYVPFGAFNGNGPYSNNLETNTFRIQQTNQLSLNYAMNGIYTGLTAFSTDANPSGIHDFAYDLSYTKLGNFNYTVGASYLYDIRDTNSGLGASYPGNGKANQFASTSTLYGNRNAAFDLNAAVGYGLYTLFGEWNTTATNASNQNGSSTGKMSAWDIAFDYAPTLWNIPTTFQISYSATHNMNNVSGFLSGMIVQAPQTMGTTDTNAGMQHDWILSMSNQFFKNVFFSPEYQYATLYNGTHTWTLTYDVSAYF